MATCGELAAVETRVQADVPPGDVMSRRWRWRDMAV